MRKVVIAFDCDGTLVNNDGQPNGKITANERVRSLFIALASMKNTRMIVWSGGGELWARQVGAAIGIDKYVDQYADKMYTSCEAVGCTDPKGTSGVCGTHHFATSLKPDIAVDDIQACELGKINLIVREK